MKKKVTFIGIAMLCGLIVFIIVLVARKPNTPSNPQNLITPAPENTTPFIVISPTVIITENRSDAPAQEWQESLQQYKIDQPDFYLMNYATYRSDSFSIRYIFKKKPTEHYAFIITLKTSDKNQAKQNAINWITSKGLRNEQIQQLDIEYRE